MSIPFFNTMFVIVFALVIGVFIFVIVLGIARWTKNNNSPRLSVPASAVSKRTRYSSNMHTHTGSMHNHMMHGGHTTYYVTFQFDSGDRTELPLLGDEYGLIAEGDVGTLTFQGTRFISFERNV